MYLCWNITLSLFESMRLLCQLDSVAMRDSSGKFSGCTFFEVTRVFKFEPNDSIERAARSESSPKIIVGENSEFASLFPTRFIESRLQRGGLAGGGLATRRTRRTRNDGHRDAAAFPAEASL